MNDDNKTYKLFDNFERLAEELLGDSGADKDCVRYSAWQRSAHKLSLLLREITDLVNYSSIQGNVYYDRDAPIIIFVDTNSEFDDRVLVNVEQLKKELLAVRRLLWSVDC